MGLVKTRRLAAMQKQQRAKAAMKPLVKGGAGGRALRDSSRRQRPKPCQRHSRSPAADLPRMKIVSC